MRLLPLIGLFAFALAAAAPAGQAASDVAPMLDDAGVALDEHMLALQMRLALGHAMLPSGAAGRHAEATARAMLAVSGTVLDRPQTLLVVDRAPGVQRLWVMVAFPGNRPWDEIGAVRVSTGKPGRKDHYKTPIGVFANTGQILGYRALGTLNEHGVRGIGAKGMRVWDFGWQTTEDWRTPGALASVRMEMHATDPALLEGRLGRQDSEGCIRIPSQFNVFLDHQGLIDGRLIADAATNPAYAALLPHDAAPTPLAGSTLVVFDSSEPGAAPSDPAEAEAIQTRFAAWLAAQNAGSPAASQTGRPAGSQGGSVREAGHPLPAAPPAKAGMTAEPISARNAIEPGPALAR